MRIRDDQTSRHTVPDLGIFRPADLDVISRIPGATLLAASLRLMPTDCSIHGDPISLQAFANSDGNLQQLPPLTTSRATDFPTFSPSRIDCRLVPDRRVFPSMATITSPSIRPASVAALPAATAIINSPRPPLIKFLPSVLWKSYGLYTDADIPAQDASVLRSWSTTRFTVAAGTTAAERPGPELAMPGLAARVDDRAARESGKRIEIESEPSVYASARRRPPRTPIALMRPYVAARPSVPRLPTERTISPGEHLSRLPVSLPGVGGQRQNG